MKKIITIRVDSKLWDKINNQAKNKEWSLNHYLVDILKKKFGENGVDHSTYNINRIKELSKKIDALEFKNPWQMLQNLALDGYVESSLTKTAKDFVSNIKRYKLTNKQIEYIGKILSKRA